MALVRTNPGPVWRVTLARPDARNAVSSAMLAELRAALADAAADPGARMVVLLGEGEDFCAGADLGELEGAAEGNGAAVYGGDLDETLSSIGEHPLPVLAAAQGAALGAGCQLLVAADLAVVAADARVGIPSARLGVIPSYESIEGIVLFLGPKRAADLLERGRVLSGGEAAAWGLVNEATPPERLGERVDAIAGEVVAAAPLSVRGAKRGIRETVSRLSLDRAREGFRVADFDLMAAAALTSDDLKEGIRAFRERRPPEFRGR